VAAASLRPDHGGTDAAVTKVSFGARFFITLIAFYRRNISPFTPPSCRFTPTCSRYAIDALRRYGALKGGWLTAWRVLRCNPFCKGGYDPLL
jgi:putative membrane protein insertion efficiency factor